MSLEIVLFYLAAAVALAATGLAVTRTNASHALIYLIISNSSTAVRAPGPIHMRG